MARSKKKDELYSLVLECSGKKDLVTYQSNLEDIDFRAYKFQKMLCDIGYTDIKVNTIKSMGTVEKLIDMVLKTNVEKITDISKYFTKKGGLGYLSNGDDCLIIPNISEESLSAIRKNFHIERNETILQFRDTSFWSSRDQGLAITNEGLYCIVDNENPNEGFYIDWGDVHHVEYQELVLYFFNEEGKNISHYNISFFAKNPSNPAQLGKRLAQLYTEMAQLVEKKDNPIELIAQEAYEIAENGNTSDAIQKLQDALEQVQDESKWYIYYNIANLYFRDKNMKETIRNCTTGLKYCENSSPAHVKLATLRSNASTKVDNYKLARVDCFDVLQYATEEECNGKGCKNYAHNNFSLFDERFTEEFLNLPYNERKVILPVREYTDLHQKSLTVLKLENFPKIDLPIGHPAANQLYVGHPLIPSKYIQFENYQLELVEDRVREFCILAQSLGATEIKIETVNALSKDENLNGKSSSDSNVDYALASTDVSINKDFSRHMIDELTKTISLHQTFEPKGKPTLPNGMVWYNSEPSWQRLYSQRVNGGLTSHEERIETKKNQMLEGRELSEIKGELKVLFDKMEVSMSSEEESKLVQQENAIISVKVKFAPLNQLMTDNTKNLSKNIPTGSSLTPDEEEYLNEYKEISADGEISERDRRFLEKIKKANGISDERAREIEDMIIPKLSEEEQEYLDEYREIISDGEISARDQRFLDKLKSANGISEERARELEGMV